MSIKAKFAEAAEKIFQAFDDVPETVIYKSLGEQTYNTTTGIIEQPVTSINCQMIPEKIDSETLRSYGKMNQEDKANLYSEFLQGIFKAAELTVAPKKGDTVTRPDGTTWMAFDYYTDPANATWTILFKR